MNERGVPCPSKADPGRNRHRSGQAWQVTTVAAILSNPRYTGRQVWNRQPANRHCPDRRDEPIPGLEVRSRATSTQWAISREVVHPPLVTEAQFVRVQAVRTAPVPADGPSTLAVWGPARVDWARVDDPRSTAGVVRTVSGLFTDLYDLRMAASYVRRGMTAPATFGLFARALP